MNVNEAMTTPVKCCSPDSSLEDVARMMWSNDIGSIPIVSHDNRPIGIVTDRDIAMCAMLNHQPLWEIPASKVIEGQHLVCCSQQESIDTAVQKMERAGVRRVLITDDGGALCGILSLGDTVAFVEKDTDGDSIPAIESGQLIGMLRRVSGHHDSGGHPLIQVS